jgi:hypothetical protein
LAAASIRRRRLAAPHEPVRGHLDGADLALSDITITEARAEHLDFSTPYLKAPPSILVRPGTEVADGNAARGLRAGRCSTTRR